MSWYKINLDWRHLPLPWRIGVAAAGWLLLISGSHWWLNLDHSERRVITMGYMPVITNLAAPLLDYAARDGDGARFRALKFASFAEMAEALRNNQIQAAFMIAPLSIVLRQQGEDVKIIYIGNRHESTLVVRRDLNVKQLSGLSGKTLAVPMRYSGHNLSILQLMEETGLAGKINIVEMNPPDMASALASGALDAYYVGEPFAAQTLKSGDASLIHYVEDVWKNFICNLVLVRQDFIKNNPEIVQMLVQGAARSGIWAGKNPHSAARIASEYWNQPLDLVEYALTAPQKRIVYDRYVPKHEEMQQIADLMVRFDLIENNNIAGLIEDRFAKAADVDGVTDLACILQPCRKMTALQDELNIPIMILED
jgi:NitT/TauT family transport system substrate-binding protein